MALLKLSSLGRECMQGESSMSKAIIRKDEHGLFLRVGGYVFRPVKSNEGSHYSHVKESREDGTSQFKEGDAVNANHRRSTTVGVLKARGIEEWWHSHGTYLGPLTRSEDCWIPASTEPTRPSAAFGLSDIIHVRPIMKVKRSRKQ